MNVTTLVLACALAALVAAPAHAQQPDFSGTWQLDRGASEIAEFDRDRRGGAGRGGARGRRGSGGFGGGGRGGPRGFGGPAEKLVITQSSDLLTIEERTARGNRSISYRLDGGESTSAGPRGTLVTASRWDGGVLLTVGTLELVTTRGDFSMDLVEQRSLAADGLTMTVESVRMPPFGEVASTLIYRKDVPR